jgi:hypothetical protein
MNDTHSKRHSALTELLSVVMLCVAIFDCYAECRYAECRCTEFHSAECRGAQ